MRDRRIFAWVLAILLAATVVGLAHGLLGIANPLLGGVWFGQLFLFSFAVALAHAVIVGVPVALLYRAHGWTNLIGVAIGGFLIGIVPFSLLAVIAFPQLYLSNLMFLAMLGGYGVLGALVFWLALRAFDPTDRVPVEPARDEFR